jgi:hypothetical protein
MTPNRLFRTWLRPFAGLTALAAMLALSACGGGSGAPNNPYLPPGNIAGPLTVLPSTATAYSGNPSTLTVSGGTPPYSVFSSNPAILPVTQAVAGSTILLLPANVGAGTTVQITVQDAVGLVASAAVLVNPAPLLPNLITVLPNGDCSGTNNLCSGGTGTASVVVTGPTGGGIPGRQVRFDVITGSYAIQSTNPALPLVNSWTVVTDANGNASVGIVVNVNAVTQIATIRATDITTGNEVTGNFTIQQVTDGSAVLSVIPNGVTTITGPTTTTCSAGADVAYYIFGGTPPYTVAVPFVGNVSLVGVPVFTNGGHFDVITNGSCFTAMPFVITDATGRTIPGGSSPTLTNALGTAAPPPPATLSVSPPSAANNACSGKTFNFVPIGGTGSYSVTATPGPGPVIASVPSPPVSGTTVSVSGLLTGSGITTVTFVDQSSPKQSVSATINCT